MASNSHLDHVLAIIAIIISALALGLAGAQYRQVKQLFELSGPVVKVKPSVQLKKDGSREEKLSQEEQPHLIARDFGNYDVIYLEAYAKPSLKK